jgi:hypothetical protein
MMDTTAHAEFYPVDYSKMVRGGDSRREGELTRRFHCVEDHANVIRLKVPTRCRYMLGLSARTQTHLKGEEAKMCGIWER